MRAALTACALAAMKRVAVIFLVGLAPVNVYAEPCREASITEPTPFMGNNDEIFRLTDGSIWKVQYEYEYLYEYYPRVVICPDQGKLIIKGKVLTVAPLSPNLPRNQPSSNLPGAPPAPGQSKIPGQIVVVAARSGCRDYFIANGPQGYYLLEWYGGYSPSVGDVIIGNLGGYGFKDVFYPGSGSKGRLYIDDFLLSRSTAIEKYSEKCS